MKSKHILFYLCIAVLILSGQARAAEFQSLGFESSSMGGAGVACAKGSFAPYYNPALLAEHRHKLEMALSVGVGIRENDLVDHIDSLAEIGITDTLQQLSDNLDTMSGTGMTDLISNNTITGGVTQGVQADIAVIKNELRALSASELSGLILMPSLCLGIQVGRFGFGAFGLAELAVHDVIDPSHLDMIFQYEYNNNTYYVEYNETNNQFSLSNYTEYTENSLEYAVDNGLNHLKLIGLTYMEFPISYGHSFNTSLGALNLGASFKVMIGQVVDYTVSVDTESGDIADEIKDEVEDDTSYGIDFGLLFRPQKLSRLSLGLVAKNINTPEFDTERSNTVEIDPQVRAGIAYNILGDRLTLAFDLDITSNETFIPGYDSQFIGGGINFHPLSWLSVRGGAMQNIQESNDGTIITAGLGLGVKWFQLDLTGQYSTKTGEFDGNDIPRYSRLQLSIVSKWL